MGYFDQGSFELNFLNWLSIGSSSAILGTILWIKITRPEYLDRVSLRIQIAIAIVDIVRHLNLLYSHSANDTVCALFGFLYFFCYHATTFLNMAIATNLQLIYLHEKTPPESLGFFLSFIPISIALVLDGVPLVLKAYGRSIDTSCFLDSKYVHRETVKRILLFCTSYPGLVYCFIIPVLVMIKLLLKSTVKNLLRPSRFHDSLSRTLAFRTSLYPLACSLCHLGSMVYSLEGSYYKRSNPILFKWAFITLGINGLVNSFCFLLDPFIIESFTYHPIAVMPDSSEETQSPPQEPNPKNTKPSYSPPIEYNSPENETEIIFGRSKESSEPSSSNQVGTSRRRYVQPITIPGARDSINGEEFDKNGLDDEWRHLYKLV